MFATFLRADGSFEDLGQAQHLLVYHLCILILKATGWIILILSYTFQRMYIFWISKVTYGRDQSKLGSVLTSEVFKGNYFFVTLTQ